MDPLGLSVTLKNFNLISTHDIEKLGTIPDVKQAIDLINGVRKELLENTSKKFMSCFENRDMQGLI
jgi:hypothetical protein